MSVTVLKSLTELKAFRAAIAPGRKVSLIPTMGALHEGHASLIRHGRKIAGDDGVVIASVFVNPTQFTPTEDFARYPRTLEHDCQILAAAGADAVFAPAPQDMYPEIGGTLSTEHSQASVSVDPGPLGNILEGALRPGHFRGVCTVVLKLVNLVLPTYLVMGQKDYQQNAVLRQMIRDLNAPTEHIMCPIIREADGVAMSSRNRYLSADERKRAMGLVEALNWASAEYRKGNQNGAALAAGMREHLLARQLEPQYAIAAHAEKLTEYTGAINGPAVLLIAVKNGATRLIDNMLL